MEETKNTIRNYLDARGVSNQLKGYYYLENAIVIALHKPFLSCKDIFSEMMNDESVNTALEGAENRVYSSVVYALKKSKSNASVNKFIKQAAYNINKSYVKEENKIC